MIDNNTNMLQKTAQIVNAEVTVNEIKSSTVIVSPYLDTSTAAKYLCKTVSWMLRQKDIPYYRGRPNLYLKDDLDKWMTEKRRYEPLGSRK